MTTVKANAPGSAQAAPVLEPTTQKLIDGIAAAGGPALYTLSPQAAREVLTQVQAALVTKLPASIEDTTFPIGPTGTTPIRIVWSRA